MPNSFTPGSLVDTAMKCLATALLSPAAPRPSSSQSRAAAALVRVSRVVKVLELTTKRVVAGSRSWVAAYRSTGSTLETNRLIRSGEA